MNYPQTCWPIITKALAPFLLLAIFTNAVAQKNDNGINFPFQIIYAENVSNSKGENIKALDLIGIDEVLTVRKDGFLSMVHYFGFPVEVTGDSIIAIKNLDFIIDNSKGKKKRKAYEYSARPYLKYLYISEPHLARKGKLSATGACHDCYVPDIAVHYPPRYKLFKIDYMDDLCLEWQDTGTPQYKIEIRNAFDDLLLTFTSTKNELRIKGFALDSLRQEDEFLTLRITDVTTQKTSALFMLRKFPNKQLINPNTCSIESPTYALLTALEIELFLSDNTAEAEKYFKLAAQLSDKAFYKEMLENFKRRHEE